MPQKKSKSTSTKKQKIRAKISLSKGNAALRKAVARQARAHKARMNKKQQARLAALAKSLRSETAKLDRALKQQPAYTSFTTKASKLKIADKRMRRTKGYRPSAIQSSYAKMLRQAHGKAGVNVKRVARMISRALDPELEAQLAHRRMLSFAASLKPRRRVNPPALALMLRPTFGFRHTSGASTALATGAIESWGILSASSSHSRGAVGQVIRIPLGYSTIKVRAEIVIDRTQLTLRSTGNSGDITYGSVGAFLELGGVNTYQVVSRTIAYKTIIGPDYEDLIVSTPQTIQIEATFTVPSGLIRDFGVRAGLEGYASGTPDSEISASIAGRVIWISVEGQ